MSCCASRSTVRRRIVSRWSHRVLPLARAILALNKFILPIQPRGIRLNPFSRRGPRQFVNLPPMEEQAAVPEGIMIQITSRTVGADMAVDQPGLAILHCGVP